MRRSEIEEQNNYLLKRQRDLRWAADVVTDAFMKFEEVEAVAVIGSVSKPLWKEIPRFREFRQARIEVWHECWGLDLAVWLSARDRLGELRRARDVAMRRAYDARRRVIVDGLRAAGQRRRRGTRLAELHVPVRINGDAALLKGVMKEQAPMGTHFQAPR